MSNIKKIRFIEKKIISHSKGNIMKYIQKSDKNYLNFGEVYFSWIKKNNFKGWKFHKKMHMNLVVPVGSVRFVFYYNKKFKVITIGEKKYCRI